MNQRLSYSEAAPAVYKAMLALQASVVKSGLGKDLMDLVCLPFHIARSERSDANFHSGQQSFHQFQIAGLSCSIHIWT
jgi:hypothetical protein